VSWAADQPSVTAPIVGARTVQQLAENLGAAHLHLDAEATATLDAISAPQSGGCPYGAFGTTQRARDLDGSQAQAELVAEGSDTPPGRV
jgi:aryl-alcohol dehydrogenase (NADP+)